MRENLHTFIDDANKSIHEMVVRAKNQMTKMFGEDLDMQLTE
jgi:hypothetical protein